jgi:peptidoglycan-associated lipoprotein
MEGEVKMNRGRLIVVLAIAAVSITGCAKKKAAGLNPSTPPPAPAVETPVSRPAPVQAAETRQITPVAPAPKPAYPDEKTRARIDQLLAKLNDAYFDYDQAGLRPDAITTMAANSRELRDILADYPDYKLTIEGHCDERGSAEYNIALGDQRANAAKSYLVQVGITAGQLLAVSYGKEKPACLQSDEACWQKNRRIHIVAANKPPQE